MDLNAYRRAAFVVAATAALSAHGQTPHLTGGDRATLPVSEIVLYSSGVGFFERAGEIQGSKDLELRFKVDEINDLLKSMVVQDFNGGHVSIVSYESRDPITKTLKSFGIDLTSNPSQGDLLNQMRGERVEILWPGKLVGTILGVEKKQEPVGENKTVEVEYLNVLTDDGMQSIRLSQVQKIKLLNDRLSRELRQALEVLASGHDTQKKTVSIAFDGEGKRKVSVSYIQQAPVWKTTYRLVLDEKKKPFLQGWAIVENTSDEDWENVRMSLVSGRPISFVMDLYQPLYVQRPVVQPEQYLSLRPQLYGEAMEPEQEKLQDQLGRGVRGRTDLALGLAPAPSGQAVFSGLAAANGMVANGPVAAKAESRLNREFFAYDLASAAQGAEVGELFQYEIAAPVTLARQKSAMLPIINQTVAGEKVSIYNESVQAKYPLNGFRLKNTTDLNLMQGPITVFDSGAYAGDARIEDIAPGQERLLSYGLDLKTEVEPQYSGKPNDLLTVKIRNGTLIATRKAEEEHVFNVRNRDTREKTVLVEYPFRSDWKLVQPKTKPERTRDLYRFPVDVAPDKTARLVVDEEKQYDERIALINSPDDTILLYARSRKVSPKVQEALRHVLSLRDKLNQTTAERTRDEKTRSDISQEQSRIRENMQRLSQNSDLYIRYVRKLDQQETELEKLHNQIEQLKDTETRQQQELNDYLNHLTLE